MLRKLTNTSWVLSSSSLLHSTKRFHFSFVDMNTRVCLAYIDHNNYNIRRERLTMREYMFSRVAKQWIARTCFIKKDSIWCKGLLQDALRIKLTSDLPPDCAPHPPLMTSVSTKHFCGKVFDANEDQFLYTKEKTHGIYTDFVWFMDLFFHCFVLMFYCWILSAILTCNAKYFGLYIL